MSALWPVQVALYDRLGTIPGFAVFAGQADPESDGDHIVIGDGTETNRHSYSRRGHVGVETVHVWTRGGGSVARARQAVEQIREAVEGAPLVVDGHDAAVIDVRPVLTIKSEGWWHIPVQIRIGTRVSA